MYLAPQPTTPLHEMVHGSMKRKHQCQGDEAAANHFATKAAQSTVPPVVDGEREYHCSAEWVR